MYHNFIFDLYGTLVDIAGTAAQISSVKDGRPHRTFSLRLPGDLRCGHFPDSVYRKRDPPHRSPSDRYRSVLPDRIPEYLAMLSRHDQHITAPLISSDEGCCKPDPAFFRILFDRYGLDPADCLMIGNERTSDLAGALAAGIDCCYLHTATSSGSADEPPKEACFTVMEGDSYALQKLLLSLAKIK